MATDPGLETDLTLETELTLEKVQRWMQACILGPRTSEETMLSDAARGLVLPSKTLSALERLDIYRSMYLPRMEEALAIDYPALKHFLGAEEFMRLVKRYVDVYPSRNYTLNRLGDHLPEFIATLTGLAKKEFCVDLARLEYALTMVFDANETPPLTPDAVRAVPDEAWETARLKPIDAFRLLAFDYPVSRYVGAVDGENRIPRLARKKNWVVAYRRNYQVHRIDLTEPSYELLSALASGRTMGDAIMAVLSRKWHPSLKQSQLFEWFRDWMAEGLFQAVELVDAKAIAAS
jgi:hypothetical protein